MQFCCHILFACLLVCYSLESKALVHYVAAHAVAKKITQPIKERRVAQKYSGTKAAGYDYVTINGTRIHYRSQGTGPVILAIHGMGDSLHSFNDFANILQDQYRIVRLDLPGHGLSEETLTKTFSREIFLYYIHQFVKALNLNEFSLVGNSLGGYIAWNYANKYPQHVNKLVLLAPLTYPFVVPKIISAVGSPPAQYILPTTTNMIGKPPEFLFRKALEFHFGDPEKVSAELVKRFSDFYDYKRNLNAYLQLTKDVKQFYQVAPTNLKMIKAPTLVIWGELDRRISASQLQLWQKDLPSAETILYPGIGHLIQTEDPDLLSHDVVNFLNR